MNSSFLWGFLSGIFIGAMGLYYVQGFSGKRKQVEQMKVVNNEFNQLLESYPDFVNQIKSDLANPENQSIREFFVVEKSAIMNSSVPRLRYNLADDILPFLNRLEALGYIEKVPNDSLLYKIQERFIAQLKSEPTNLPRL